MGFARRFRHHPGHRVSALSFQGKYFANGVVVAKKMRSYLFGEYNGIGFAQDRSGIARFELKTQDRKEGRLGKKATNAQCQARFGSSIRPLHTAHEPHGGGHHTEITFQRIAHRIGRSSDFHVRIECIHPANAVGLRVKRIVVELVANDEDNREAAGHTQCQASNIEYREKAVFREAAQGNFQVIL